MTVTAIIPAYNEEKTIAQVVSEVKDHALIEEVIVVSDGSTDNTAKVAKSQGVKIIELFINQGKGAAIKAGIDNSSSDIILFLDADLIGLKEEHINKLLTPVLSGQVDTTVGVFAEGRVLTDMAQRVAPFLSGQRVIKRELLMNIDGLDLTKYGVEIALTIYLRKNKIKIKEVVLEDMSHVMKEEKLGVLKGFFERLKMYRDIIRSLAIVRKIK